MKAVVVGPGRIGCGLAGERLHASGYQVVFLGRNRQLVDNFNAVGQYRVRLTSRTEQRDVVVDGIRAVSLEDFEQAARVIADADVIAISVGASNLQHVAPVIASGLARRLRPANVLAFENLINAGPHLRGCVTESLGYPVERHGFSGALVSRAVTQRLGEVAGNKPLTFLADMPQEFAVDRSALRSPLPRVRGMIAVDNYLAWVLRKLYIFSAGHATTAYLAALKGYHYIHTAIRDPEIRAAVIAAMAEGQKGIAARFGPEFAGGREHLEAILRRFDNPSLNDPVGRVGRDPRRKLAANERLVGAAKLAELAGVLPDKLALATAAAFCFSDPEDPSCREFRRSVKESGLETALSDICGLEPDGDLRHKVAALCARLQPGNQGNLLLSLDRGQWAWS